MQYKGITITFRSLTKIEDTLLGDMHITISYKQFGAEETE